MRFLDAFAKVVLGFSAMTLPALNAEQREAIHETRGLPIHVLDRVTAEKYVLMHESVYQSTLAVVEDHDPATAEILKPSGW
jgi:hypothetical protein